MDERLCLLTVHAHPDDEASKGASTVALYHARGVRTVLVCCTGGEEGDILNPALDTPEMQGRLAEVRREELARAARVIGYDEVVMLGYRDSGMKGAEANSHPDCFANADLGEATDRLVEIIRRERPQVVVTYPEDQGTYQHPDMCTMYTACENKPITTFMFWSPLESLQGEADNRYKKWQTLIFNKDSHPTAQESNSHLPVTLM